ncbi:MAG: VOC family protein [Acidobacteriaceae bacterium]|nr:VOC family protein [Acidobacteriaceae bacterium]
MAVNPIPKGYHTATPYLIVNDGNRALEFYKKAFGATVIAKMDGPPGKIGHAEFKIGDSIVMLSDEMPGGTGKSPQALGTSTVSIFLYVENVDSVFNQAVSAGAKADMPPQDMFWGDRFGKLTDPFGHLWGVATHVEDVAPEEMKKRAEAAMAQMAQAAGGQGS